ncbi:MAG: hypothetical protein FWH41_09930 [Treponema sp.]|nr:hypothetical protein [Treponema sp.]
MSDSIENPYESPQAEAGTINPLSDKILTENMIYYLKGASPWLRFIGIAGLIFIGLVILVLIIAVVGITRAVPSSEGSAFIGLMGGGVAFIYILMMAIYIFPLLFMYRFGKKIKTYLYTGTNEDLEDAFKNNKSLWTFMGVLLIIFLGFFALALFSGMIGAIFTLF